jgi:hypothetical protein
MGTEKWGQRNGTKKWGQIYFFPYPGARQESRQKIDLSPFLCVPISLPPFFVPIFLHYSGLLAVYYRE